MNIFIFLVKEMGQFDRVQNILALIMEPLFNVLADFRKDWFVLNRLKEKAINLLRIAVLSRPDNVKRFISLRLMLDIESDDDDRTSSKSE